MKSIINIINTRYLILWVCSTYISGRLYYKNMIQIDFRLWENDITTIACFGYVFLTYKLYTQLIK